MITFRITYYGGLVKNIQCRADQETAFTRFYCRARKILSFRRMQ